MVCCERLLFQLLYLGAELCDLKFTFVPNPCESVERELWGLKLTSVLILERLSCFKCNCEIPNLLFYLKVVVRCQIYFCISPLNVLVGCKAFVKSGGYFGISALCLVGGIIIHSFSITIHLIFLFLTICFNECFFPYLDALETLISFFLWNCSTESRHPTPLYPQKRACLVLSRNGPQWLVELNFRI